MLLIQENSLHYFLLLTLLFSFTAPATEYQLFDPLPISAAQKTQVSADSLSMSKQQKIFNGNVKLRGNNYMLTADTLMVSTPINSFSGSVKLQAQQLQLSTPHLIMDTELKINSASNSRYSLIEQKLNGESVSLNLWGNYIYQLTDSKISTCPINSDGSSQDWHLEAADMTIDNVKGWAYANNMILKVKNVPIMYFPVLYFPTDKRRKSGLTGFEYGSSNIDGKNYRLPFYLNISSDTDYFGEVNTIANRGELHSGKLRYLGTNSYSEFFAEDIKQDRITGTDRGYWGMKQAGILGPKLNYEIDYQRTTDIHYFNDYDYIEGRDELTYLNRMARMQYVDSSWNAQIKTHEFQSLTTNAKQYQLLPQMTANWTPNSHINTQVEHTTFAHKNKDKIEAKRFHSSLNLYHTFAKSYLEITPKLIFTNAEYTDVTNKAEQQYYNSSQTFSLDNKIFFERPLANGWRQTLEPRLYYARREEKDESQIPLFDSAAIGFSHSSLFDDKVYSGKDRNGEINRASLGIGSRFIKDGQTSLALNLAQAYRYNLEQDNTTNVIATSVFSYGNWSASTNLDLEPKKYDLITNTSSFKYQQGAKKFFKIDYTDYRASKNVVAKYGGRWALNPKWQVFYSSHREQKRIKKTAYGLVYSSCCWEFMAGFEKKIEDFYNLDPDNIEHENTFYFSVSLLGLTQNMIESNINKILDL